MPKVALLTPVGPAEIEAERTGEVLAGLWAHEPGVSWVVLVDDGAEDRQLASRAQPPASCQLVSLRNLPHPKRLGGFGGLCTAVLLGLRWVHKFTDAEFCLRIDTDALIIAPFADKIHAAFARLPQVGILGSFDRTCNGTMRDFSPHHPLLRSALLPWPPWGKRAVIRKLIHTALAHGYRLGEHCLGGAYAVSRELLERMAVQGHFLDPLLCQITRRSRVPEDVMMGIFTRVVGLESANLTAEGEPFGLSYVGIADSPERLLARGYSIIHSVKNDPRYSEQDIRRFFAARR